MGVGGSQPSYGGSSGSNGAGGSGMSGGPSSGLGNGMDGSGGGGPGGQMATANLFEIKKRSIDFFQHVSAKT
jgi:hypothetical protein